MAWCSLQHMFDKMFDVFLPQATRLDPQEPGHIWCTIGMDGVPLWHSHVVSISCSTCVALDGTGQHAMERYFIAAVLRGHDSVQVVCDMLKKCKMQADISNIMQTTVKQNLGSYGVRIFVWGDHMLQYKVLRADGPTSTHVDRQPSPYCTTPGDAVRGFSRPTCPLATTQKCNALVKGVPVAQHPPDILHGICNVLFTIVIPLFANLFMDDLQWTATTTQQFLKRYPEPHGQVTAYNRSPVH